MIPETCILNNRHKLYVTLHHECNVIPGDGYSSCGECGYLKERRIQLEEKYKVFMSPTNHNISPTIHNYPNVLSQQHSHNIEAFYNQPNLNKNIYSDDGFFMHDEYEKAIQKITSKPNIFKAISKAVRIIFKGGTNNDS
jgi:hypothetical protein